MQSFFAQISIAYTLPTGSAVMEDGTQLACAIACFLLGRFATPLIFKALGPKFGGSAKIIDDETCQTSEASADSHAGLALLLEHYGVLGAPRGSWSGRGEMAAREPSVDEVSDYFRVALADEAAGAETSERHLGVPSEMDDAPSGLTLLEHYGILGAPCGSWSGRDESRESEPSLDEVSDYFRVALDGEGIATE